jgi:hypothetical protein
MKDDLNDNLIVKEPTLIFKGKKHKEYFYFYNKDENGQKDKETGIRRLTIFSYMYLHNDEKLNEETVIPASFIDKMFYWKDLEKNMQVKYFE